MGMVANSPGINCTCPDYSAMVLDFGFLFAGLASLFAMIASIINFQILGALGFFVLMGIFWGILGAISEG